MHSAHFSEAELGCRCGCGVNAVVQDLLDALEALRAIVGAPVIVNCAYRCLAHNAAVGGVPDSQHVLGRAADIQVAGKTARELYEQALQVPLIKGLGVSNHLGYLHIDVRESVLVSRWCYSDTGGAIPWHEA
jgi:uncharacterized protein YcbK (DUF882 family)